MRGLSVSLLVWLLLVWVMLWGRITVAVVVFGLVVALGVRLLFPLPDVRSRFFAHPHRLVGLVAYLTWDVVLSGLRVVWLVLRHGSSTKGAVIAVPVLSDTEQVIVVAANLLSLAPGNFVLQIDRERLIFYVYALDVRSPAQADRVHDELLNRQLRVIKAFGTAQEIRQARAQVETTRRMHPGTTTEEVQ
jgi:multicomponent Na+:H+ antiporter subunit E